MTAHQLTVNSSDVCIMCEKNIVFVVIIILTRLIMSKQKVKTTERQVLISTLVNTSLLENHV